MRNKNKIYTTLCAAFCGTGKSYLCDNFINSFQELECWEYQGVDFPNNYIKDIINKIGMVKYLFISTNPIVLKELDKKGFEIMLIYPKKEIKNEYFKRYIERNSHPDFIETLNKYWDIWLDELKEQNYCKHTILDSGKYLQDVFLLK